MSVSTSGATAVVLPRPGERLGASVWLGLLAGTAALALAAVSIPVLSALYGVFVPMSFLIVMSHAAALVLAPYRPGVATGLSVAAVLATAVFTVTSSGLPWPLPVPTMITQLLVCAVVALRGDPVRAVMALVASLAAASAPLLFAVFQGDLWSVGFGNLVTFGAVGVLVTTGGLVASALLPGSGLRSEP
ncbi:MAG: hypothetical protein GX555_13525 [Actinomycetales bacterium]|mgnify:FL=1|nr:hypothetical protein [Actinomycetales bacterium]